MSQKCSKCGKDIREEEANYCPYCAEPLKRTKRRSAKVTFVLGVVVLFIGIVAVVVVGEPRIDPNRMPFPAAPAELFYSGVLCILSGIFIIAYSLLYKIRNI